MEKLLIIDGRSVGFKSTGAFLLKYKAQFQRDALKDIYKLQRATDESGAVTDIEALDMELFYNLIWTLAKTYDRTIPPPMEWLDTFDEFPIMDILPELTGLIYTSFSSSVDSKKK